MLWPSLGFGLPVRVWLRCVALCELLSGQQMSARREWGLEYFAWPVTVTAWRRTVKEATKKKRSNTAWRIHAVRRYSSLEDSRFFFTVSQRSSYYQRFGRINNTWIRPVNSINFRTSRIACLMVLPVVDGWSFWQQSTLVDSYIISISVTFILQPGRMMLSQGEGWSYPAVAVYSTAAVCGTSPPP